jgi:hypothetical protein
MTTERKISWAVSIAVCILVICAAIVGAQDDRVERARESDCREFLDESLKNGLIAPSDGDAAYAACMRVMPATGEKR